MDNIFTNLSRKRSIWNQCKKYIYWQPTDRRPTD